MTLGPAKLDLTVLIGPPSEGLRTNERGSVLMLVPAAVLVLITLAAIAVDSAVTFMGQRELSSAAAAAANDAASVALTDRLFYEEAGRIEIDDDAAREVVADVVRAHAPRGVRIIDVDVETAGPVVCVALTGRVERIFARAIPGVARTTTVKGQATATAAEGPAGSAVARPSIC